MYPQQSVLIVYRFSKFYPLFSFIHKVVVANNAIFDMVFFPLVKRAVKIVVKMELCHV